MTALERVDRAIARIKRGWTQGAFARDANGHSTDPECDAAVCWCIEGALGDDDHHGIAGLMTRFREAAGLSREWGHAWTWNDAMTRTQADVLRVLHEMRRRLAARKAAR